MKLFIVGHGRHGKDTVADHLKNMFGFKVANSSWFAAERVVLPWMLDHGVFYKTVQECYDDRHNYRTQWYHAIREYNENDDSRLSREIFSGHDVYVGIRSRDEFLAAEHLVDLTIWVDATSRVEFRDPTIQIRSSDCDVVIDNNGTTDDLRRHMFKLGKVLDGYCKQPVW